MGGIIRRADLMENRTCLQHSKVDGGVRESRKNPFRSDSGGRRVFAAAEPVVDRFFPAAVIFHLLRRRRQVIILIEQVCS